MTDPRLAAITLDGVELSIRSLKALKDLGAVTLADAQRLIFERKLHKQKGVGPRTVREVQEIIDYVLHSEPINLSECWFVGASAEREVTIAYIKAEAQRLYDLGEDYRAAVDALTHLAFGIKCRAHWTGRMKESH